MYRCSVKNIYIHTLPSASNGNKAIDEGTSLLPAIITQKRSSYASLLDLDEGTAPPYFPPVEVNDLRCAKITHKDVKTELDYWQTAVLCSVLGANPPIEVMEGFLRRIWKTQHIDKICMVKHCLFLIHFHSAEMQQLITKKGVFFFDRKPMIVKPWNPKLDLHTEDL